MDIQKKKEQHHTQHQSQHRQDHVQHQAQHHSYGRTGILQPTAIRCVMKSHNTTTNTSNFTPAALQRSATTMTHDDLHSSALRSSTKRPESLHEGKRKSDPTEEVNRSLLDIFSSPKMGSFFGRLGSGKFNHGSSGASKKGQEGGASSQNTRKGQGGQAAQTTSGKKNQIESGRYEKKAAATFYELTEEKGEAVGEVGIVEEEVAPPSIPKHRQSDPGKTRPRFFGKDSGNRKSKKVKNPERNGNKATEPDRTQGRVTDTRKGATLPPEPQRHSGNATEPQKGTTQPSPNSCGVPQGSRAGPGTSRSTNNTTDSTGTPEAHTGTTESQKGRRKVSKGTKEPEKPGTDVAKAGKRKTTKRAHKARLQCANAATTDEEEVDGGGGGGGVGGADKTWTRGSFRGRFGGAAEGLSSASGDPSHSDTELGKLSAPHSLLDGECGSVGRGSVGEGSLALERSMDMGQVAGWAMSFEKLLEDPAGLHTFAEFLKKEYSHENIYFWTACERYKRLNTQEELQAMAREIFERHLYSGAPEPVNVDSQARQDAQDGLHLPNECLFAQAQKQIFNLMKFDSYTRFLKSPLYTDCLSRERRGQPLPYPGDHTLDPDLRIAPDDSHIKLKKSRSDADERRRKSILPPWSRKDRSKSKDRGEAEYRKTRKHQQHHHHHHHHHQRLTSDSSSLRSISGSQTSLNSSSDLPAMGRRAASRESLTSGGDQGSISGGEGGGSGVGGGSSTHSRSSSNTVTCRVFLPDSSKSVVLLRPSETIHEVMLRLMERRGLTFRDFNVYLESNNKLLCREDDAMTLKDKKVRLEPRVLFQLVMPGQKTQFLKADPSKAIGDKLKPFLSKSGLKLDLLHIHKEGEEKTLNLKGPISELDGARVIVQTKEDVREWGVEGAMRHKRRGGGGGNNTTTTNNTSNTTTNTTSTTTAAAANTNPLDEITNRVFEDLRNGKMEQYEHFSIIDLDARSCRTDSSDKSSGIRGEFSRRNSFGLEKDHSGTGSNMRMFGKQRLTDAERLRAIHHPDHHHHHHLITKRRGGGGGANTSAAANGGGGGVNNADNDNELYEGLKRAQRSRLDDQRGTEINFELPEFLKNDKKQDTAGRPPSLADQLLARLECSVGVGVGGAGGHPPDYFSLAHPEVWGGLPSPPPPPPTAAAASPNATLVADPDLDLDDFEDTLRGEGGDADPPSPPAPPGTILGLEGVGAGGAVGAIPPRVPLTALPLSPPPLPPKPKVGGVRGPPPRPPSRQLHLLNPPPPSFPPPPPSTSNSEEEGVLGLPDQPPPLPPLHLGRQSHDKFNISFV